MSASDVDGDDVEDFEDAQEELSPVELSQAIQQCQDALDLFFNNQFTEAQNLLRQRCGHSIYHALGYGVFMYLRAMMTFDPKDIEVAALTLKRSVSVCNRYRRHPSFTETIGRIMKKSDYASFTEDEIHAELCYAECLLLRTVLAFIEDETFVSFLKCGMKIRSCYHSYRECKQILEERDWSHDPNREHFESGVRLGVGAFNLILSTLPQRVMKLLELVGFSANKERGLAELERGFQLENSLRRFLCGLALLVYHTLVNYLFGNVDGDLTLAKDIVDIYVTKYPNGVWFLFFKARLQLLLGRSDAAVQLYKRSYEIQDEWTQFHHICYWELIMTNVFKGSFREAEKYARYLLEESRWSKAVYAYLKGCCMCMRLDELTDAEREDLRETMRSIPLLKKRLAGKSIPIEKFAVKKAARFFAQGERLTLAGVEILYVWTGFGITAIERTNIDRTYSLIEKEVLKLQKLNLEDSKYYWEDYLLAQLLKGCALAQMQSPLQAIECFNVIFENEKKLKEDVYLLPAALIEVAHIHMRAGELHEARAMFEHAKNYYKGYYLESRLHFRIQSGLNRVSHAAHQGNGDVISPIAENASKSLAALDSSRLHQLSNTNGLQETVPPSHYELGIDIASSPDICLENNT